MDKQKSGILSIIFAILFVSFFCFLLWKITEKFLSLNIGEYIGLLIAVITGGITLLIAQYNHRKTVQRQSLEAVRQKKVEIYERFIKILGQLWTSSGSDITKKLDVKPISENELLEFMFAFKSDMLLWSSPQVIKAWLHFETESQSGGEKSLIAIDYVLKEIRKDIGLENKNLKKGDLVKIYLNSEGRNQLENLINNV